MMDAKPTKRLRASSREWQDIRDTFSEDDCWVCGGRWMELHHCISRSHLGDDVSQNLIPLCSQCHRRVEARDPEARSLIRQALMPSNLAYLRYKLGDNAEGWLSRNYPLGTFSRTALGLDLGVDSKEVTTQTRTTTNVGGGS